MNILWLSANKLGYELLKEASKIKGFNIGAIITLKENTKTVMYDGVPVNKWSKFNCNLFEIERIEDESNLIKKISPEIIVVCGWRQIIPENILRIPKLGVFGFHPSLLPYGRGSAPIINSIRNGDKEMGLTFFRLTKGLDDGAIITQERFFVNKGNHADDIYKKIIWAGKKIVRKTFSELVLGKILLKDQDHSKAFVFSKPKLTDNKIDLEKESMEEVFRKIKAFTKPYRGAYIQKDDKRLIIWRAELVEGIDDNV